MPPRGRRCIPPPPPPTTTLPGRAPLTQGRSKLLLPSARSSVWHLDSSLASSGHTRASMRPRWFWANSTSTLIVWPAA